MNKIEDLKERCKKSVEAGNGLNGGSNSVKQRQEQSEIYKKIGCALQAEGKPEEAKLWFRKQLTMDEELCINFREIATLEFWNEIAEGYYNAGMLDQRNPDLAMLRQAESLWEQLADIRPNESRYAQGLQKTRSAIAVAMKKYEAFASKRTGGTAVSRQPVRSDLNGYIARAKQGDLKAQMNLAYFYLTGEGVTKDETEAYTWLLMAVKQKNGTACYNMGLYFANGYGVPQNYADAAQWFEMAAKKGFEKAQYNLAFYYERGQGVLQDDELTAYWYMKAAEQGDSHAQCSLGACYQKGRGVPVNAAEGVSWIVKSAQQGYITAQFQLAWCYETGQGVAKDYGQALIWYKKAAAQGLSHAQFAVGSYYQDGLGVPIDYEQAAEWYLMAAKQGDEQARENLLYCVEHMSDISRELWRATVREAGLAEPEKSGKADGRNSAAGKKAATVEKKPKGGLFGRLRKK